jgi:hypothetical protein
MKSLFLHIIILSFFSFVKVASGFAGYCSEGMIRAMREEGLTNRQIQSVCTKAKRYDEEVGIKGIVKDASEKPVAGIDVHIKNSDLKTQTQKDGSFKLPVKRENIEITFSSSKLPQQFLPHTLVINSAKKDCYPKWTDVGVLKLSVIIINNSNKAFKYSSKDGRFINNGNNTVTDTKTGLTWAVKDNGNNLNWHDAKQYCKNYRAGGYTDWRLPTLNELVKIYDPKIKNRRGYHVTNFIDINYSPWAAETRGLKGAFFHFGAGKAGWYPQSESLITRALPVRDGK